MMWVIGIRWCDVDCRQVQDEIKAKLIDTCTTCNVCACIVCVRVFLCVFLYVCSAGD